MQLSIESVSAALQGDMPLCDDALTLQLGDCRLRLRSNSAELITQLRSYFSHVPTTEAEADIDVTAIERPATDLGLEFTDWRREPGKHGRKDAYLDFPNGRIVQKVRTGMLFLQSSSARIAAGPCLEYDNQVINFINAQYMNWLQHRDWLICHAAGLVYRGHGIGIAGFSGGGKSTLMLHLLDAGEISYLTNDRLFVRRHGSGTQAAGIPKLPRINPGTIVHNRKLESLIPAKERAALLELPASELWQLEDKYDVHIDQVYGPGRIVPEAPLASFLVLNWQRDSTAKTSIEPVDLRSRPDLLGAIMKSPGPFYQYRDGSFLQDDTPSSEEAYLDALRGITIYEAQGRVDFPTMVDLFVNRIMP